MKPMLMGRFKLRPRVGIEAPSGLGLRLLEVEYTDNYWT